MTGSDLTRGHRVHRVCAQRVLLAVLACTTLVLVVPPSGVAQVSDLLVPSLTDIATLGLRPVGSSLGAAREQLAAGLSSGARGLIGGAQIEVAAARTGGEQLEFDAFVVSSGTVAQRILADWRRQNRTRFVRIGNGGAVSETGTRERALVEVLWRDGARLALVVLTTTRHTSSAVSTATAYAVLAEQELAAQLPSTSLARVLDQIRPNGTLSKSTALEAFALVYGALPGVHVPGGTKTVQEDGTGAAMWALSYRSRMTKAQVRVVDRLTGVPAPGGAVRAKVADYGLLADLSG